MQEKRPRKGRLTSGNFPTLRLHPALANSSRPGSTTWLAQSSPGASNSTLCRLFGGIATDGWSLSVASTPQTRQSPRTSTHSHLTNLSPFKETHPARHTPPRGPQSRPSSASGPSAYSLVAYPPRLWSRRLAPCPSPGPLWKRAAVDYGSRAE